MRLPLAFAEGKASKNGAEGGVLRAARIDAKGNFSRGGRHMADAHLAEPDAVCRTFDAKVVLAAAEAVPHAPDGCVDGGRRPVRVAVYGHDASQMLEMFVLVFDGGFQPVFAVDVQSDAALVKAPFALKLRLDGKGKKFFCGTHLQDGSTVIAEVVVGPLPQVGVRCRHDLDLVFAYGKNFRRARPLHLFQVHFDSSSFSGFWEAGEVFSRSNRIAKFCSIKSSGNVGSRSCQCSQGIFVQVPQCSEPF